jgi:hypothetical protein
MRYNSRYGAQNDTMSSQRQGQYGTLTRRHRPSLDYASDTEATCSSSPRSAYYYYRNNLKNAGQNSAVSHLATLSRSQIGQSTGKASPGSGSVVCGFVSVVSFFVLFFFFTFFRYLGNYPAQLLLLSRTNPALVVELANARDTTNGFGLSPPLHFNCSIFQFFHSTPTVAITRFHHLSNISFVIYIRLKT